MEAQTVAAEGQTPASEPSAKSASSIHAILDSHRHPQLQKSSRITHFLEGREPTVSGFTSNCTLAFLTTSLHALALLLYSFHVAIPFFYIP